MPIRPDQVDHSPEFDWDDGDESWDEDAEDLDEDDDDEGWDDDEEPFEDELDDDEEYEDEEEEDDDGEFAPLEVARTLSFGLLAMAPLFLLYELGAASLAAAGDPRRSLAEVLVTVPLRPFGDGSGDLTGVRRVAVALTLLLALLISARRHWPIVGKLMRVVVEGALGALLLAPVLGWVASRTAPLGGGSVARGEGAPGTFAEIAAAMGGAAYEELVFRIGALSLIYAVTHHLLERFGWPEGFARASGACAGALLSAVLFAAVHLEGFALLLGGALGHGGEAFDAAVFTWRTAAGLLLGCMVVWRGVGVAAWAHAFFNLAVLLRLN